MNRFAKACLVAGVCLCFLYSRFLRASPPLKIFCNEIERVTRERRGEYRNLKLSHIAWQAVELIDQVVAQRKKLKEPFGAPLQKVMLSVDDLLLSGGRLRTNEILFNRAVRRVVHAAEQVHEHIAQLDIPSVRADEKLFAEKASELVELLLRELFVQNRQRDTIKIIRSAFVYAGNCRVKVQQIVTLAAAGAIVLGALWVAGRYWSQVAPVKDRKNPQQEPSKTFSTVATQTETHMSEVFNRTDLEAVINMTGQELQERYDAYSATQRPASRTIHDILDNQESRERFTGVEQGGNRFDWVIDLSGFELTSLEGLEQIEGIERIQRLDVSENKLSQLPSNLPTIVPHLKRINLRENHFSRVPDGLRHFSQLNRVLIERNPFIASRTELLELKRSWQERGVALFFE